jgi:hypothetical protein
MTDKIKIACRPMPYANRMSGVVTHISLMPHSWFQLQKQQLMPFRSIRSESSHTTYGRANHECWPSLPYVGFRHGPP